MDLLERVEIEPPIFANNPLIYFDVNKRNYIDQFVVSLANIKNFGGNNI